MTLATIKLTPYVKKKCQEFAEKCASTNKDEYARRNQRNLEKIKLDITIGKIGEWAAMKYLQELGYKVSKPDFEIYAAKQKSFDADLSYEGVNVHVKSQSEDSARKFGISWLFQKKDPLYRKPDSDDEMIGVVVGDKEAKIVLYKGVEDLVFGEPKVPMLRNSKVAIYLKDQE